jgi:hypothetical protein
MSQENVENVKAARPQRSPAGYFMRDSGGLCRWTLDVVDLRSPLVELSHVRRHVDRPADHLLD